MTAITTIEKISEEGMDSPGNFSSNAFFKALIDNTRDVIAVLDENGILSYISPSAEPMTGFSQDELLGRSIFDFIHPDDKERISGIFYELLKTSGESLHIFFRFLHKGGISLSIEGGYRNLLKDQTVSGVILTMRNVTGRERSEEALRQSEARYRTVAETASDAIVSVDQNSTILFANKSTEKIFGYRIEELVGNNLTVLMPEYLRLLHNQGMNRHIHTGQKHIPWEAVAVPGLHKDGHEIPLEISFGKFIDNGNHIFTGIIRDVSERRKTEAELALRDKAIDMAAEGIMITDARFSDNPLIYVNRGFEQITGYSKEEVIGKNGIFLEGPDTDLDAAADIYTIIREKRAGKVEILNYKKDGTPFWNLLSLTPLSNADGVITNYIAVQTDITERKRIEEQIQAAFKKEKELSEMKSHFITTASHEFRTPLSAILSSAEILEHYGFKISEDKKAIHLQKIQNAAKSITDILEDILTYNKAEAGSLIFNPVEVNIVELCEAIVSDVITQYQATNIVQLDNHLENNIIIIDKDLLRPVLENILSNSIKFSDPGTPISLRIENQDDLLKITVADNGIGIPKDDITHIFEPFHRGTNAGNIQGAGLGLSIVRRTVEFQGGMVSLESEPGKGTHITITIPIANTEL